MKRKLRIRGQTQRQHGLQFVELVAETYKLSEDDASDLISSVWGKRTPTNAYLYAQSAINDPHLNELIPQLISRVEFRCWTLYNHVLENVEFLEIDDTEEGLLEEISVYLESDMLDDEGEELRATRLSSILSTYDGLRRELALAQNAVRQAGFANEREAIKVTLAEDAYTYTVQMIIDNLQRSTDYVDSVQQPNPAIRLPGETELTLRRMGMGDALLVAAMHAFDPRWTEAKEYNRIIYREYLTLMGLSPNKRITGGDTFYPSPQEVLSLIIDYCIYALRVDTVLGYLAGTYTNLSVHRETRINGRFDRLHVQGHLTDEKAYEITVAAATFGLNQYSIMERRKSGVPSFEEHLLQRRELVGTQRLSIDANSKTQSIARRDGRSNPYGRTGESRTPPTIAGGEAGRVQLREEQPRLDPPSDTSGTETH